ncbi:GumC family protein [Oceaniradius stylonematis]|uniref:GumC family protein n=1 Tax=Oceaniradius stylonematis TaxID=2184161 RepID=UPI003C7BD455
MFDPPSTGARRSLLMRARADAAEPAERAREQDNARTFRTARARRAAQRPNPLLSALAGEPEKTSPDAEPATEHGGRPISADDRRTRPARATAATDDPRREPAMPTPQTGQPMDGALIDPIAMIATIWRWRFIIAGLTLAGAVLGVLVALGTPQRYTAYSEVLIDPREVQLVGRDLEREFLANEAALAIVDSRLSLVWSRPVLERVIEATNLDQDPEFNGEAGDGVGLRDGIGVILSLFGGETPVETSNRETLENLRDAISINRSTRTFVINIGVEARSAQKAAMLANEVTLAFVEEQGSISSDKARDANEALTGRLDELQSKVEAAERRIEQYRLENGLMTTQGRLLSEDELATASAQLAEARALTIRARTKAEQASEISVDAAISGSVPADLITSSLETFRAQHAALRQSAAQLQNQLGPRHPRLEAANAAIEAARQDIAGELQRIVQGAQSELRRTVQTEQELAAQVARAKAQVSEQTDALVTLRDLQAEAEAARAIYNGALLRARETGEIGALGTVNAAVLAEAEPPRSASSMSRKTIAVAFTVGLFLLGLGLAAAAGLRKALRLDALTVADGSAPDPGPDAPAPTRNRTKDTSTMYPGYPHAAYAPQPAAAQPQPAAQAGAPGWPQQPPVPQAYPPAAWPPAPQPWPTHDPYAQQPGAWQHPAMPPMPAPQPPHPAVWWQAGYPAPAAPQPAAAPAQPAPPQTAPSRDAEEMAELRRSIGEIRDVVEELAARRGNVRRFG